MSAGLADAEVRASVPNSHHCAIHHNHINVLGLLGQIPFSREELEQQPLQAHSGGEVHLRSTITGMASKIDKPLDLLLPNTALTASLYGMCGVLHCPSFLRCNNPSCLSLASMAQGLQ
jgi:hypothetical protein